MISKWVYVSGLPLEALITLLTPAFTPYFLILWLICGYPLFSKSVALLMSPFLANVTVCFFPIEILPPIYRYGYSMPFYNVSRTVRAILFSTRNQGWVFGLIHRGWIWLNLFGSGIKFWNSICLDRSIPDNSSIDSNLETSQRRSDLQQGCTDGERGSIIALIY